MATCTPQTLMDSAKCLACLPPNDIEVIKTSILCQIAISLGAMATCDPSTLIASAKCFACLSPAQMSLLQTQLLCEIYTSMGGGVGFGQIFCGTGDPNVAGIVPTTTCAKYYDPASAAEWCWNDTGNVWVCQIAA